MPSKGSGNNPAAIISYWLGTSDSSPAAFKTQQKLWYDSKADTDNHIQTTFGADLTSAENGDLTHWRSTPGGSLALVILLDQFSRNLYRRTPIKMMPRHKRSCLRCWKKADTCTSTSPPRLLFFILSTMLKTSGSRKKLFPCSKRCLNLHRKSGVNPLQETLPLSKATAISSGNSVDSLTETLFWNDGRRRKSVSTWNRISVLMDSSDGIRRWGRT
jgi:hypothetical protein